MKFFISDEIYEKCPEVSLGVLRYKAQVQPGNAPFLSVFESEIERLAKEYRLDQIAKRRHIASTREMYKALGKAPQEYRNSAEAMLRRIVKGNGLYHINNIVDTGNLFSVMSGLSLGSYDTEKITGDVTLRRAPEGTHYDGIGKSSINIGCLPVLYDSQGPFGNPTSDSQRAMLRDGMRDIFTAVYFFDASKEPEKAMDGLAELLREHGGAVNLRGCVIRPGDRTEGKEGICL